MLLQWEGNKNHKIQYISEESPWLFLKIYQCLVQYFNDHISIRQKTSSHTKKTIIVEEINDQNI